MDASQGFSMTRKKYNGASDAAEKRDGVEQLQEGAQLGVFEGTEADLEDCTPLRSPFSCR